jgi:L-amino acid N-acyltransferase YncA
MIQRSIRSMNLSAPRPATKNDVPAIVAILNDVIARTTATFMLHPQTLEDGVQWFMERGEAYPVVAIDAGYALVGWGALSEHNPRVGYRHTADVSVYVHPKFQRRGIGRSISMELIRRACAIGHHTLIAHCCSESAASVALHEALGFVRIGHYREVGRKFDRWLDVIALQLMLKPDTEN